jgi:hypothetical protein
MSEYKKLSPDEIRKIKDFIVKYQELYQKLEGMEGMMENIDKEKDKIHDKLVSLTDEINNLREEENDYQKSLVAKYGEFNLNLETFEIKNT